MAPKRKTTAKARTNTQEGKDVQEPQAVTESHDTPAVAENAAVEQVTEDAPRLSVEDLDVQPIAPDGDNFKRYDGHDDLTCTDTAHDTEVHNFAWAARKIQNGASVKRDAWIGNKFVSANGRDRNVLSNEDMLATDWRVI